MSQVNAISSFVKEIVANLNDVSQNAQAEAYTILSSVVGRSIQELKLNSNEILHDDDVTKINGVVTRRKQGEPLQYILGEASYYGRDFKVGPGVLIPRPETEILVEKTLEWLQENHDVYGDPARIIDMCTGCGNIAITLALEYKNCRVLGSDISEHAMIYSHKNILKHSVTGNVDLIKSDLGYQISKQYKSLMGKIDVLVSNPPYVPNDVYKKLPVEVVGYEPKQALISGEDGLAHFRKIAEFAKQSLRPNGFFACELFEKSMDKATAILKNCNFENIRVFNDLADRPRVITAIY